MAFAPLILLGVRFAPAKRRARLLAGYDIDLVIDVGANRGQYAVALRSASYAGRIASFEPLAEPYGTLAEAAASDPGWNASRLALGARRAVARVNVAEDSRNSSVLTVGERHLRAVPDSRVVARQAIEMERLDEIWPEVVDSARHPYLKIDTQGYELEVVQGAAAILGAVVLFSPIAFEGVLDDDRTGEMLQVDAIFRSR